MMAPVLSLIATVTLYEPPLAKVWMAGLPVPFIPSPKVHAKVYGPVPPLDVAFRVTGYPAAGLEGLKVRTAVGGWATGARMELVSIPDCHSSPVVKPAGLLGGERILVCRTRGIMARQMTMTVRALPIIRLLRVVQAENLNTDPRGFPSVEEVTGCASPFPGDCSVLFEGSLGTRSAILRSDQSLASGRVGSRCGRFSEDTSALRTLLLGAQDPGLCSAGFLDILG